MNKRFPVMIAAVAALASIADVEPSPSYFIRRSEEWIPATPCTAVVPGSALDFSGFDFADGPCGKYGRVIARGEHFEFERRPGEPLRFMGVNFCGGGNYLPPEDSRRLVDNLVRLGYNSVRLHHHDDAWAKAHARRRNVESPLRGNVEGVETPLRGSLKNVETPSTPSTSSTPVDFADDEIDRLDALMAACREKGVYVTTDLYVSRNVPWRDIGEDRDGNVNMSRFKILLLFHDGAMSNYLAYARSFLNHVNPYTGLRYADDPTLAWISLVNEGNAGNWDATPYREYESFVLPKWRAWLAARRALDPAYEKVPETIPEAVLKIPENDRVVAFDETAKANVGTFSATAHVIAFQQFLASVELDFLLRMKALLRDELGCKALITNLNGWLFMAPEQLVRDAFDYVDDHFYYAHPNFLGPHWTLPARITDSFPTNIRKGDEFGAPYNVTRRLFGHPFTVSEYNYCPPWRHRSSCAFLCGAAAALQDWSVLWRFCWTCSERNAVDSAKKSLNHFDMAGDPVATATERAIFCLFMRRDLPELETALATLYPPSALARPGRESADPTSFDGRWATWRTKLGGLVAETPTPGMTVFRRFGSVEGPRSRDDLAALLNCKFGEVVTSPNGEVKVDRARGSITVDTPRTAGGFVDKPGTVETSRFRAEIEGGSASAWVSSLDKRPIKETDRLLVCLVGDVQNDGIEYEDETMRVLRRWGKQEGRIAQRVAAAISVSLANAPGWRVFALNPDGSRKREVESVFRDGRLSFRADIGGDPEEAEFCYEIVSGATSSVLEAVDGRGNASATRDEAR